MCDTHSHPSPPVTLSGLRLHVTVACMQVDDAAQGGGTRPRSRSVRALSVDELRGMVPTFADIAVV
jgi:hypothetical protein